MNANARPAGPAASEPDQYQRFLEAARELGCEENMDRLDDALRRVAKTPPQPRPDHPRPKKKGEPEG
ncbi:MAG TPA: hypothetical protein VEY09_07250 [Pyrinomonadaceae bacterium]|nr:hypothetical protein [Pyrinomonadaceae bacterium]